MSTNEYTRYRRTDHAITRAAERGFTLEAVRHVLHDPELDYPDSRRDRKSQRWLWRRLASKGKDSGDGRRGGLD